LPLGRGLLFVMGMKRLLVALAVALPAAVAVLLLAPARPADNGFQRLVGGIGLGPAVDLTRCAGEFDPRVEPSCSHRFDPLPCGSLFCPVHALPRAP